MNAKEKLLLILCCLGTCNFLYASTVPSVDTLNDAIIDANDGTDTTINFDGNAVISSLVRPINTNVDFTPSSQTIVVNGNSFSVTGDSLTRCLFSRGGTGNNNTINSLTLSSGTGQGGTGGIGGGGGGLGAGGGLYVYDSSEITLVDCTIVACSAAGGAGGLNDAAGGGGGGGGLLGNGGNTFGDDDAVLAGAGGGGYAFAGGTVDSNGSQTGGGGGGTGGPGGDSTAGGAGGINFGFPPGQAGGEAGNSGSIVGMSAGQGGGGGGGGGYSFENGGGDGGDGLFGGGGGGGAGDFDAVAAGIGGSGGYGGGGGGGARFFGSDTDPNGGIGGVGGGGGTGNIGGDSSFGGGTGQSTASSTDPVTGGGGAGLGGGLFLMASRNGGATVNIESSFSISGNTAVGGAGNEMGVGLGQDIFMASGSTLNFDITSNVTIPTAIESDNGVIGGSGGGLNKDGTARLNLNGTNTYTGSTIVNGGELQIVGSVTSPITVSGGTLSGDFTINPNFESPADPTLLTLTTGTIQPGVNGVGTINVDGGYEQTGGVLNVDITAAPAKDLIMVTTTTGASVTGGDLLVTVGAGNYINGTEFLIVDGPSTGAFDSGTVPLSNGAAAGDISLTVAFFDTPSPMALGQPPPNGGIVLTIGTTSLFEFQDVDPGIPQAIVDCIRAEPPLPGTDFATVVELLGALSNTAVNRALIDISANTYGALEWIHARNMSQSAYILSQHRWELCCNQRDCCEDPNSFWVATYGNIMNQDKYNDLYGFDANAVGALVGYDRCVCDFILGGAVGYTKSFLTIDRTYSTGKINTYYGSLYASWNSCWVDVDLAAVGGASDQHVKKKIVFTGVDRTAKSTHWGYFFTGHLGLTSEWGFCNFYLEPFALADYHYLCEESFREHGANSLNLHVRSKDQHFIRGEAGLRLRYEISACNYCFAPYLGVSWVGDFPLNDSRQKANFVGQSCIQNIRSYWSDQQMGSPEAGVIFSRCNGLSVIAGYKGLFNGDTRNQQLELRLEWDF